MKKGLSIVSILIAVLFVTSSFSLRENPQDPPRGAKKHIKLIKEKNGEKVELDTVIESGMQFVWEGDTVGKELKWISENEFSFGSDSLKKSEIFEYNIDVTDDGDGNKIRIFKHSNGESKIHEFNGKGNAVWFDSDGQKAIFHTTQIMATPHVSAMKVRSGGNVIDLSDPGIISFKKKKLSGGREKIEIIRNEVNTEMEAMDVIFEKRGTPSLLHEGNPEISKEVKIIKEDGGVFHVFESDEDALKSGEEQDGNVFIKEIKKGDGKIIHIEETKEGDGKKVKVTVTEDVEKESKEKKEGGN